MTADRFPPDRDDEEEEVVWLRVTDPEPEPTGGTSIGYVSGWHKSVGVHVRAVVRSDDIRDLQDVQPPTLAEAVAWLKADDDNTVEWWEARTGIWVVHDDPYFWRYQVADSPARADEPQPGYRLATRPPKIRPEVQAVRDVHSPEDEI